MQRGLKSNTAANPTRIADLRASLRASQPTVEPKLAKPPKPRKLPRRESEEDRVIRAEKLAMAHHTTSLLNGGQNAGKDYKRPAERMERKKGSFGGLVVQLLLVAAVAGGVAYALDPTIVPAEWMTKAQKFISQYIRL